MHLRYMRRVSQICAALGIFYCKVALEKASQGVVCIAKIRMHLRYIALDLRWFAMCSLLQFVRGWGLGYDSLQMEMQCKNCDLNPFSTTMEF